MATPSTPQRKPAGANVSPVGNATGGGSYRPVRKSAEPFGSVDKSTYNRTNAPVDPNTVPINDKDAGKGTGNVR